MDLDEINEKLASLDGLMWCWEDQADENREFGLRETRLVLRELQDTMDKLTAEAREDGDDERFQRLLDEIGGLVVELELNRRAENK